MSLPLDPAFASTVLNALEDLELPLLSWGVTTGTLSHEEVLDVVDRALTAGPASCAHSMPEEVLDALLCHALLFRVPDTSPPRYRTRLAETIRLTSRLRQLFAPHDLGRPPTSWWERGRPLVADYRLHVAPRRYPVRDVSLDQLLGLLRESRTWGQLQDAVAAAQVGDRELAAFQVSATRAVVSALAGTKDHGVIVGAGTGSGKTLAFYLPAFAAMAERALPGRYQVHTLAVYPRKELLRDQFRDAVSTARTVQAALSSQGRRPLRIGALYGDTPHASSDGRLEAGRSWRRRSGGLVCPYLACPGSIPGSTCGGDLVWADADRRKDREILRCASCGLTLGDEVALTRDSMNRRPPDLLFTTTEMLNRQASTSLGRMMGWQGGSAPSLMLLDEVHTYAGVHGAQVALLLRRWRNDVRSPVTFVGLSATLRDARAFFAQLTGLDDSIVDHVEPTPAQLREEGREYAIALRGDPVSGASLLSTSIQAAMLYGRILDPPGEEFLHGSTGFIFTDDLDVTNRFYDDLREAEGHQDRSGRRHGKVLAALRSPDAPDRGRRFNDGQSWDLVEKIGRALPPTADIGHLRVGRTSSQDVGVDLDAELIIATASLEVGYNDPRVGLVLQHKAPYDTAAFLQRRGRAGRRRDMRPWTVITLSDYGRDRLAYQAYDTLFAPEVPPRSLPVGNRFVLKIQGTQALLDWATAKLAASGGTPDPRSLLRAPTDRRPPRSGHVQALTRLLESVLTDSTLQDDLAAHLRRALKISKDEVLALLWEQPRALLLGVVPTALRRLRTNWEPVAPDPGATPGALLPEYLTQALFGALNVPEVHLEMPFPDVENDAMPIEKALSREAVPGRVSRRYGHRRDEHRTWLPLPAPGSAGVLDLNDLIAAGTRQGLWHPLDHDPIEVVRPLRLKLVAPPDEVTDQAQGTPQWASQILEPDAGLYPADVPQPSPWGTRITAVGFATHAAGNPVQVRRVTMGADCETSYRDGRNERSSVRYTIDGTPAAMGFELLVDAMRFTVAPLNLTDDAVAVHLTSPAWRTLAFTRAVAEDPDLAEVTNTFQRGWLTLVYLTACTLAGLDATRSLQQIHADLAKGAWRDHLVSVLQVLYRDGSTNGQAASPQRLVATLEAMSRDPIVTASLDRNGQLLWAPDIIARTAHLARRAYPDTIAAAVLAAAQRACPDAQDRDLIVDVIHGQAPGDPATVWLSETAMGGLGVVEHLVRFYAQDPRRFWGLVDSTLQPGDHEYVDATLTRLLEHVTNTPGGTAARAMADLRAPASARRADSALHELRAAWTALDGHPRHAAVAALSTRLLRPGSTSDTDRTAIALLQAWDHLEQRLGFEIDARAVAYAVGSGRLPMDGAGPLTGDQVFSMLWPRGGPARVSHLQHYQPYAAPPILDRLLAAAAHDQRLPRIDVTCEDWVSRYRSALAEHGAVDLTAPTDQSPALAKALRHVPVLAVDRDVLRVHGQVRQTLRLGRLLHARVEIPEVMQ